MVRKRRPFPEQLLLQINAHRAKAVRLAPLKNFVGALLHNFGHIIVEPKRLKGAQIRLDYYRRLTGDGADIFYCHG